MGFPLRLRHQLLLVSLLVLCLPWAGCQFVRETESAMLKGQELALLASARAISLRLADDESLPLTQGSPPTEANPIYFHALSQAPVIDGFDDDWRNFPIQPGIMSGVESTTELPDSPPAVYSGTYRGLSYLFIRIPDQTLDHLNPSQDPLRSGDYLRIVRANQPDLYLGASAPGNVNARFMEAGQLRPEYNLTGVWNHTGTDYQIELRARPRLLESTLALEFVDISKGVGSGVYQIGLGDAKPLPFVRSDPTIAQELDVFASSGLRLAVLDAQGWLLAHAGNLRQVVESEPRQLGLINRLYRVILKDEDTQPLPAWESRGRLDSEDIQQALSGVDSIAWFSLGDRKVGRGSIPIYRDDALVGAVIVEQTTDSLTTSTNHAFNRLLFWSLASMLIVGFGLISYASLLSFRIRRLSKAAELAMDVSGQIRNDFPVSKFDDEVGDLSRSFDQLLARLSEYTDYLRTLSSKLSHELKTPLAVVRSSLDNLDQQELSDNAKVYTDRARDGAARLSAIFAALSSATRLEESIQAAELERVNIADMITALHSAYVDAYPLANIELHVAPEIRGLEAMMAPELIVQMLDKLVDNAVDFCAEEGLIKLSVHPDRAGYRIELSNDGPLLPEEMQQHLFDSLVSVRSNGSDQPHLGLGMYIARLIAEFHAGTIFAENRGDETGVTVTVRLPLSSPLLPQSGSV